MIDRQSKYQSGAALIIGLIFLLLMSIVGLSAMKNVTLQERINGNNVSYNRIFQVAESTLANAEKATIAAAKTAAATAAFLQNNMIKNIVDDNFLTDEQMADSSHWPCLDLAYNEANEADDNQFCNRVVNQEAVVLIKYEQDELQAGLYRITVWAQGMGRSTVILQSEFQSK